MWIHFCNFKQQLASNSKSVLQMFFSFAKKCYFHPAHSSLFKHDLTNYISLCWSAQMLSFFKSLLILTKCSCLTLLLMHFFHSFFVSNNYCAYFEYFIRFFEAFLLFKEVFLCFLKIELSNRISSSLRYSLWISELDIWWECLWLGF